jgi:subtilase family serine protease
MRAVIRTVVLVLAVGLVGVPAASAASSQNVRYARAVPVCKPPKPGHVACLAMKLVRATATTKGAKAYRLAGGATAAGTIGPVGGLTPSDLATAYRYATTGGTGQKVAIIDWGNDPTIASDLNTFDTNYGLTACTTANGCLSVLNQSGATSPLPSDQGAAVEISLDVEAVHSVCPKCKIDLIEVNSNSFASTEAGENEAAALGATEISNSYGGADLQSNSGFPGSSDLAAYNHPGIVITVSTGDHGYYGFDTWVSTPSGGPAANPSAPLFPAELSTVVAVGGTSLFLNQTGGRSYETVWNEDGPGDKVELETGAAQGAGGGGCSWHVAAPGWQTALPSWSLTACGSNRLDGDVAAVADPFTGFDIYNTSDGGTGWETIGGTSLAAPVAAAMYALAGGAHGVPYPALTLYGHLGSTTVLNDITAGGNGFCGGEGASQCNYQGFNPNNLAVQGGTVPLGTMDCAFAPYPANAVSAGDLACDAATGYDGPTGVGTPHGLGAFAKVSPSATISGPTSVTHNVANSWSATSLKDPFPGGSVTSFSWNWGDGTPNSTGSAAGHTYTTTGTKKITLTVTDNYGVTGTKTLSVTVS